MKKILLQMHIFLYKAICQEALKTNKTVTLVIVEILFDYFVNQDSNISEKDRLMIITSKKRKSHAQFVKSIERKTELNKKHKKILKNLESNEELRDIF